MNTPSASLSGQTVKFAGFSFLASLLVGTIFLFSPNFASASSTPPCQSHGVVTDAADGVSVTLTVTLEGKCSTEPLTLNAITTDGVATTLAVGDQTRTATGTQATVSFVPQDGVQYEATIYEAFAVTLSK